MLYLDLVPAPSWLNSGDTAWQLVAATLVGLMSGPGLAILYAGLMKCKWVVNSSLMVLYGFGATLIVWSFWGYKMGAATSSTSLPASPAWSRPGWWARAWASTVSNRPRPRRRPRPPPGRSPPELGRGGERDRSHSPPSAPPPR